jgi:CubicO group peptidase (beta-lactamase class C family)
MVRRLAWLPLVTLIAAPAQADSSAIERVRAVITSPLGAAGPGCAVGVFRQGKAVERINAGAADVTGRRLIGPDTQFYAASVSKQFTAVALMQQVVAGKVKLGDSVRKYIPQLGPYADAITVQMLLNMTSGMRDSLTLLGLEGNEDISAPTRAEALATLYRQIDTKFTPGTQYDYTNGGYLLLSEIVERVAGQPFEQYVNRQVLQPLGMTRSFVMLGKRTTDPNVARGYVVPGGTVKDADSYPLFGGSGGLITTINDLAKWDKDIDTGHRVWTPAITQLMTAPGTFTNGRPVLRTGRGIAYGNALLIGPNWFHHTGGASGFKTLYGRMPEKRTGIALLCNNGDIDPAPKVDEVIAALAEGLPPVTELSGDGSAINGTYANPNIAARYTLALADDTLSIVRMGSSGASRPPVTARRQKDGSFRWDGNVLTPDDDAQGFILAVPRVTLHFVRVP